MILGVVSELSMEHMELYTSHSFEREVHDSSMILGIQVRTVVVDLNKNASSTDKSMAMVHVRPGTRPPSLLGMALCRQSICLYYEVCIQDHKDDMPGSRGILVQEAMSY